MRRVAILAFAGIMGCSDSASPELFLVLSPASLTLQTCQQQLVSASVSRTNASQVLFQSNDPTVATVSASGSVRGMKAGATRVHAYLSDQPNVRDSTDVTVTGAPCTT